MLGHFLFILSAIFLLTKVALGTEIKLNEADFRLRSETGNRVEYSPKGNSSLSLRFLPSLNLDDEKINLFFVPIFTTKIDQQSKVDIHQLYLDYKINDHYGLKLGRQELNYNNKKMLSSNFWSFNPQSYDTFKFYSTGYQHYNFEIFYSPLKNDSLNYLDNSPSYQAGLNQKLIYTNFINELTFLFRKTVSSGAPNFTPSRTRNEWNLGLSSNYDNDYLTIELNHIQQYYDITFTNQKQFAYSQNIDLGYHFSNILIFNQITPKLTAFKTHEKYLDYLGKNHGELGILDIWSKRNIKGLGVISDFKIKENNLITLKFLSLHRIDTNDHLSGFDNIKFDTERRSYSSKIGTEEDLTIITKIEKKLSLSVEVGHFTPSNYIKDLYGQEHLYKVYGEVIYDL